MGMAVEPGRRSVGSPSGVRNASVGVEGFGIIRSALLDKLLQLCDLAHLFESENLVSLVPVDRQACRIIAAVFEPRKA